MDSINKTEEQVVSPVEIVQPIDKVPKSKVVILLVVFILIVCTVFFFFFRTTNTSNQETNQKSLSETAQIPATNSDEQNKNLDTNTIVSESQNSCGDDFDCLIASVSKCQIADGTISATIKYPFFEEVDYSANVKYAIEPSGDENNCVMLSTLISYSLTISDANRKSLIAKGSTDDEINEQLILMRESIDQIVNKITTCKGTATALSTFIVDAKNNPGDINVSASSDGETTTSTTTTSTGEKVVCNI